jgi:hypothetical protein
MEYFSDANKRLAGLKVVSGMVEDWRMTAIAAAINGIWHAASTGEAPPPPSLYDLEAFSPTDQLLACAAFTEASPAVEQAFRYTCGKHGAKVTPDREPAFKLALRNLMFAVNRPKFTAPAGSGLNAWLKSDDAGISAVALAALTMGREQIARDVDVQFVPRDLEEFSRSLSLIHACPTVRSGIAGIPQARPGSPWARLAARWEEAENLHKEGRGVELQTLLGQCQTPSKTPHKMVAS